MFFECDLMAQLREVIEQEQHFVFISYMAEMENLLCVTKEGLIMSYSFEVIFIV